MFQDRSPFMEFIKPKLKYLTTVDFGRVTYDDGFFELLKKKMLTIDEDRHIKREWFKGEYRLIISSVENGKSVEVKAAGITPAYLRQYPARRAEKKIHLIDH